MEFKDLLNTPDESAQFDVSDIEANKIWGGLAYILFFLPLIACPDSSFGKFHANQGLLLIILSVLINLVCLPVSHIPLLGGIICWILRALPTVGTIFGLVTAFQCQARKLPLIGDLFTIIK